MTLDHAYEDPSAGTAGDDKASSNRSAADMSDDTAAMIAKQISDHPIGSLALAAAAGAAVGLLLSGGNHRTDTPQTSPDEADDLDKVRRKWARELKDAIPSRTRLRSITNELVSSLDDPGARDRLTRNANRLPDELDKLLKMWLPH
jgi:hypothetical protein